LILNHGATRIRIAQQTLKALIVKECDKDIAPEPIGDDERLIGGPLELDSLRCLAKFCLAVQDRYDVRLEGNDARRRWFRSARWRR